MNDGDSFEPNRYVKVPGVCYSVRPTSADKIYWGPYHTIAEAQAVKNALILCATAESKAPHAECQDLYAIHFEERVW